MAVTALLFLTLFSGIGIAQDGFESYYLYLGNHPSQDTPGWNEEAQGLTHDHNNWFITQREALWKIPVSQNLAAPASPGMAGVERILLGNVPQLVNQGYNHFGDPSYYAFGGQGYILIPIEGGPPGLAVFRADTLQYVDHATFVGQTHAPWVAVDPQGNVYSSNDDDVTAINNYLINWNAVRNSQNLTLSKAPSVSLFDEAASPVLLQGMQGGVISPSGRLLYVVANAIHVFDLSTGRRIQQSTNGHGYFNYEFHPGGTIQEEPEGITIWNLDDGRAPGISGQLHVLLLDNDLPDDDDVYVKHYTHTIYVDRNYTGGEQGRPWDPFNTVSEANNLAWDGAQIKIKVGSYAESLVLSKRIRVLADGGVVRIGE